MQHLGVLYAEITRVLATRQKPSLLLVASACLVVPVQNFPGLLETVQCIFFFFAHAFL